MLHHPSSILIFQETHFICFFGREFDQKLISQEYFPNFFSNPISDNV